MSDESLLLVRADRLWLGPELCRLARRRPAGSRLVEYSLAEWLRIFQKCARTLGVAQTQAHFYVLRHTGASDDFLRHHLTLAKIKRRGRWCADASVKRYEKAARIWNQAKDLAPEILLI